MYHIIMYLYQLGVAIASLFSDKVKTMRRGEKDAYRVLREKVDPAAQYIWVHAASLGEFEQGRPIIEHIRRNYPQYKILLTFFSPSGYEVRKNYEGADIVCYLPIDTPTNARRFLRTIRPVMAYFIKYEFWFNYLHILKHRNVPVYSVSSIFRPNQIFFRWYGKDYARALYCITKFYVQNEISKTLLAGMGITNVEIVGDTRFDRVVDIANQSKTLPIVEAFRDGKRTFIAGSSWGPDEEIFIPYLSNHKDWKLIIAPHVIGEEHLQQISALLAGRKVLRYTTMRDALNQNGGDSLTEEQQRELREAEVLIIDCFGLLSSIYKYGDVTYVGGGFGVGIHNVLEAAVWSKPVFFGPNHERFQEAMQLKASGGGIAITGAEDFARTMDRFVADADYTQELGRKAGEYVKSRTGATAKVCSDTIKA